MNPRCFQDGSRDMSARSQCFMALLLEVVLGNQLAHSLCRDSGRESNTILTVELFVRLEMISVSVCV